MVRFEGKSSVQQANKEMEIRGVVKDKSGGTITGRNCAYRGDPIRNGHGNGW